MTKNLLNKYLFKLDANIGKQPNKKTVLIILILIVVSLASLFFISTNENLYGNPIAKITSITENESKEENSTGKIEPMKNQKN
ncbi:uncharacterized protein YxeA [Clostridium beijerinckii]|nr:uncharacterized protein YxeA [Clostridium beijerinckii]